MTVERARVNLKVGQRAAKLAERGSASSTCSGSTALRVRDEGKKKRGVAHEITRERTFDVEGALPVDLVSGETTPPSETDTSRSLSLDLRTRASCYNPSSLRTSEIPASPTGGATYRCYDDDGAKKRRRRRPDIADSMDAYVLSLAEKAVERLLAAVTMIERTQARERETIEDAVERDAAAERDRRANDEFVRCWLVEEGTRLGTLGAARFGELWDSMRREKNDAHSRGITFGAWLSEKRDKMREEHARQEVERREKEEAQQVRREEAQRAYDRWRAEAMSRPALPPLVVYTTDRGTLKYVRRGSFCNPNPWVDILEEERRKQKLLAEKEEAESRRSLPRPPSTRRGGAPAVNASSMLPLNVTRLGGGGEARRPRQSTYDNLADFYTDLLRRCGERCRQAGRRRERGEVAPLHSRAPTPARDLDTSHAYVATRPQTRHSHPHTPHESRSFAPVTAHRNVVSQEPVHSPGPVYLHTPAYGYVPIHPQMPVITYATVHPQMMSSDLWQVYSHELVDGLAPVHSYQPVYPPEPVHSQQQAHPCQPVHGYAPVYPPGPVHSLQQAQSFEPVQPVQYTSAHAPSQVQSLQQAQSFEHGYSPVHSPEQVYTSEKVNASQQTHATEPNPTPTPVPGHASRRYVAGHAQEQVPPLVPTRNQGAEYSPVPLHVTPLDTPKSEEDAVVPAHCPSPGKCQHDTDESLTAAAQRSGVQSSAPPTELLPV